MKKSDAQRRETSPHVNSTGEGNVAVAGEEKGVEEDAVARCGGGGGVAVLEEEVVEMVAVVSSWRWCQW